ncbi:hypothetical protein ACMFMG_001104 [Clarireedia jacksonii]
MRTTSPLSLLLLLHLSTSTPIPILNSNSQEQEAQPCRQPSCYNHPSLSPISKPTITNPHFPTHQLSTPPFSNPVPPPPPSNTYPSQEIIINNTPITPSSDTLSAEALSAPEPLSSSYLQSLSPSSVDEDDDDTLPLPSKPTSALPELRKADAKKFWAEKGQKSAKVEGAAMRCMGVKGGHEDERRGSPMMRTRRRDSSDFLVVGVVILFLLVVCWVEFYG